MRSTSTNVLGFVVAALVASLIQAADATNKLRRQLPQLGNGQGPVVDLRDDLAESNKYNDNKVSDALSAFLTQQEGLVDGSLIKSYVILEKGKKIAEYYKTESVNSLTQQNVFSVNKGFTSVYCAMLIDQGFFSLETKLADIWDDSDPVWINITDAPLKQQITIQELLDSTSGFDDTPFGPSFDANGGQTLAEVLEFPIRVSDRGVFNYLGFANVLNYAILELTGLTPQEWAAENFFPSLGMEEGSYTWNTNTEGVATARNGLLLSTLDMAKFGQLLLQGGKSSKRNQLFPRQWAIDITSSRVPVLEDDALRPGLGLSADDALSYSLMFWNLEDLQTTCAFGFAGQYICVWPKYKVVAAVTTEASFGPIPAETAQAFLETVTNAVS